MTRTLIVEHGPARFEAGYFDVRIGFETGRGRNTTSLGVPIADEDEAIRIADYLRRTLRPHHVAAQMAHRRRVDQ